MNRLIFASPATNMPTGGILNYFALAQVARDLGYDAIVASEPGLDVWWMEPDISQEWVELSQLDLGKEDYVVAPEWWYRYREMVGDATIIPYAQNHTYTIKYSSEYRWALSRYIARDRRIGGTLIERALFPFWQDQENTQRYGALIVPTKNAHEYAPLVSESLEAHGIDVTVVTTPVDAQTMLSLYNSHLYYVPLSFPEGLDMMSQEAMACGCCVVGFDGGGRSDYLFSGHTGISVPDGDWNAVVDAVLRVHKNKSLRKKLARDGKEWIQRYRPSTAAEQLDAALKALP